MATLSRDCSRGRPRFANSFLYRASERKSIALCGITEQEANVWKLHFEQLLACSIPPIATSAWVPTYQRRIDRSCQRWIDRNRTGRYSTQV